MPDSLTFPNAARYLSSFIFVDNFRSAAYHLLPQQAHTATMEEKLDRKAGDGGHRPPSPVNLKERRRTSVAAEKILKHSHDADEAMKAFESGEIIEIDQATNKRLLKIIDQNLMPLMCVVYGLNFLDKTTLSYASVMGIKKDIHLVGDDYQWLGSMFYFGYLAWEYPTNRLLQRLPLAKYSAFCIIMWGATLACFAAVSNFSGAVAVRFFLGVFEAAVTPGFALFTSQWYTKKEQGARTGFWFSFNG
jgi:MFS transporter, ACS family, allantoate permease